MQTAWNNLALTFQGLKALGLTDDALKSFPDDFRQGMAARKVRIGDVGTSDPSHWSAPFTDPSKIHAVLIVAADTLQLLDARVAVLKTPAFMAGTEVFGDAVQGRAREDAERGHEHFGFKDGVSQPGQDPIIAQAPQGQFQLDKKNGAIAVKHFVTTSGGEYVFQPSIGAPQQIGAGKIK